MSYGRNYRSNVFTHLPSRFCISNVGVMWWTHLLLGAYTYEEYTLPTTNEGTYVSLCLDGEILIWTKISLSQ